MYLPTFRYVYSTYCMSQQQVAFLPRIARARRLYGAFAFKCNYECVRIIMMIGTAHIASYVDTNAKLFALTTSVPVAFHFTNEHLSINNTYIYVRTTYR